MNELQTVRNANDESDSAPLFVALYVVVLAFFILLNAISTIDEKKHKDAMNSILSTFDMPREMESSLDQPNTSFETVMDPMLAALLEAAADIITIDAPLPELDGDTIVMTVNTDNIFETGDEEIRPDREDFLRRIIKAVQSPPIGVSVASEIRIGVTRLDNDAEVTQLAIRRAGKLARILHASGIPHSRLSTGLRPNHKGQMDFVFFLLPEERAR